MTDTPHPPPLARWLLNRALPRGSRGACIAGDLLEEFHKDVTRRSRAYASRRYWRHTLSLAVRYGVRRRQRSGATDDGGRHPWSWWFDEAKHDLRYACRSTVRNPAFAVVAVLTLGIGVGATTAIFGVLRAVVIRDLPYRHAERLAVLWTLNLRQSIRDGSSFLNFRDWKAESRQFADMAVYRRPEFTLGTIGGNAEPERVHLALVGPEFFGVLDSTPLHGRTLVASDFEAGERPIVISHRLWRQRFGGDMRVVGRAIEIDGISSPVVGVMPSTFRFPAAETDVWGPISVLPLWERLQREPRSRDGDQLMVVGRLAPGATFETARLELDSIAARLREMYPDTNAERGVSIEPLTEHLLGPNTERSLWLLMGAVGFVLLIACVNVSNLMLARSSTRRVELSVRKALGASASRLFRQALTENLALAGLAAVVGLVVAWLVAIALRTWAVSALPRLDTVSVDSGVVLFALAVSLCGAVAGLLPGMLLTRTPPGTTLAEGTSRLPGGRGGRRVRHVLVVIELALAVVLLSGAGLLIRSFMRVQGADRGFDSGHVLLLQVDLPTRYDGQAAKAEFYRTAFERIGSLPGVVAAGAISDMFVERHPDLRITLEGQSAHAAEPAPPLIRDRVVPGYFEALGIPLLRGRFLQESDLAQDLDIQQPVAVVVNDAMARRFWPDHNPVGKRFKYGRSPRANDPWITVVGVVADMKRDALDRPAVPCLFSPGYASQMDVVVRTTSDPGDIQDAVRAELLALDPTVPPYGVIVVERRLRETVALRTLQTMLLAALATVAFALAVVGVYGIVHHAVASRTQEIGVRMALGATDTSVLRMMLSNALGVAVAGIAVGQLGALALGRAISSFLYETSSADAVTFVVVPALLLVVTTAAALAPARRAARIDPVAALRLE